MTINSFDEQNPKATDRIKQNLLHSVHCMSRQRKQDRQRVCASCSEKHTEIEHNVQYKHTVIRNTAVDSSDEKISDNPVRTVRENTYSTLALQECLDRISFVLCRICLFGTSHTFHNEFASINQNVTCIIFYFTNHFKALLMRIN